MPASKGAAPLSKGHTVVWMTAGTAMLGLSGYVFLSVIGHGRFDIRTAAALSSTYLLINILANGVFVAVEQESSRTVSHAIASGNEPAGAIRRLIIITFGLMVATLIILALAAPVLLSKVLDGRLDLLAVIACAVFGSAMVFLIRGIFGGQSRFGNYAFTLMVDGGVRLAGCVILAILGSRSPAAYAAALAAGPVLASGAAFLTRPGRRDNLPATFGRMPVALHPTPSWSSLNRGVLWLLISSVLWMSMANLAPVIVTAALPMAPAVAAGFAVALILTRIPLLLMAPVQALFLPRLTRAVASADLNDFFRQIRKGLLGVAVVGAGSVAGFALLGRWAIATLFGDDVDTNSRGILALLATSATILMVILFLQPALVALRLSRPMVLGWVVGTAVLLACFFLLPFTPLTSAIWAQLAGPAATLIIHSVALIRGLARMKLSSAVEETTSESTWLT